MPIVKATTGIHLSRRFASVVSLLTSKVSLLNCPCFAPLIAIHACDAMAFASAERAGPAGAAVKSYADLVNRIGPNPNRLCSAKTRCRYSGAAWRRICRAPRGSFELDLALDRPREADAGDRHRRLGGQLFVALE